MKTQHWILIAAGAGIAYYMYKKNKTTATGTSNALGGARIGINSSPRVRCPKGQDFCHALGKCSTRTECWVAGGL